MQNYCGTEKCIPGVDLRVRSWNMGGTLISLKEEGKRMIVMN